MTPFLLSERCRHVESLSRTTQRAPTGSLTTSAGGWKLTQSATLNACEIPERADLSKTAKKPRPSSRDFLSSLHEMHPYSVYPLPWKLKGYDFVSSENKPTRQNTPRWTNRERRQLIWFLYMWMAIVDDEIRKKDSKEPEEVLWRELQIRLRLE